jgi:hypothetical protein
MVRTHGADRDPGAEVQAFLHSLEHGRKDEVEAVREITLSAHPGVTERIKWNAPSFCVDGDDRITFRLQPGDRVELVFHRGARRRGDAATFSFEDGSGILRWVARDRALVTFRNADDVEAKRAALKDLVHRWMIATAGQGGGDEPGTQPV